MIISSYEKYNIKGEDQYETKMDNRMQIV